MKLLKNRIFLGTASIVLALVICLVIAPVLNTSAGKQIEIVRVVKTIPTGTAITNDMISHTKVGGFNLPANVVKSEKEVIGKYATATLQTGDYILTTKTSNQAPGAYLMKLGVKKQAVSISVKSFAAGLSGKLKSGDIVSLIAADYGDLKETVLSPNLQYVKVLAATNNTGTDNTDDKSVKDKKTQEDMPSTLTLLVTSEQAKNLVDYETNGQLHATLVYRGCDKEAQKFLKIEDKYLNKTGGTTGNGQ